jgi:serine/threonine protein kinase
MVNDDLTLLKIIDFGYATPLNMDELDKNESAFLKKRLSCTKNYMAPELYQ